MVLCFVQLNPSRGHRRQRAARSNAINGSRQRAEWGVSGRAMGECAMWVGGCVRCVDV